MLLAAVYDIHGNLPALEAVLEDIRLQGVDRIVVGGDVVPGPMPRQCLAALLDVSVPLDFVHGNGETDTLALHRGGELVRVPAQFHEVMRWVESQLLPEDLASFDRWPRSIRLELSGLGRVLFCHATPRDDNEIFTRLTPEKQLRPIFQPVDADVVVCGHTHMQFDRVVGDVRVVNAGSVGMPFGDPGAYWALLGPTGIELRCTPYDLEAATARIGATEYPSEFEVRRPPPEAAMLEVFGEVVSRPGELRRGESRRDA